MPSIIAATMLFGILAVIPLSTHAHDGEDHSEEVMSEDAQIEQMMALIALLQELLEMLIEQHGGDMSDMHDDHDHADDHDHDEMHDEMEDEDDDSHDYTELYISVEEHGGVTHIHVYEPGMDEAKFFLEGIALTETDAIITAIAEETGLTEEEVEAAADFHDDEEDEMDDDHDHDEMEDEHEDDHDEHGDDDEYEGIHIMSDGTIMLGNGDVVEGATITDDGMIELEDGTLLEPEFDLR